MWANRTTAIEPTFDDVKFSICSPQTRDAVVAHLRTRIAVLTQIVRQQEATRPDGTTESEDDDEKSIDQGPGISITFEKRHDNDYADVKSIQIIPTKEEIVFDEVTPYLPANTYEVPHHLPAESAARLLDIQFRLLREDLM